MKLKTGITYIAKTKCASVQAYLDGIGQIHPEAEMIFKGNWCYFYRNKIAIWDCNPSFAKANLIITEKSMSRQHHYLKTETEYYQAVEAGKKSLELRFNDRNYQVGDIIYLEETVNGVYTGRRYKPLEIKYIMHGGKYGLEEGYCIMCW